MMHLTRSSLLWTTVASLLAVSALLGVSGMQSAQAQTQETTITIDNFFVRYRSELQPGAQEKLQGAIDQARKCPSDITVEFLSSFHRSVNPLRGNYMLPVGTERWNSLNRLLREYTGDGDIKVEALWDYSSQVVSDNPREPHAFVRWTLKPDQDRPKLDVVWMPSKGKKVKPGDKITAKLTARDDATTAQTGIARLRVDVGVGGGLVAAPVQFPSPVPLQECGRENPVRTYEATYTVPANPPPVVQLRAYARDFAGNEILDDAEFPTGDWYGSFKWKHTCTGGGNTDETLGTADLTLDYDGRGNLTGMLTGSTPERKQTIPPCTFAQVAPATFSAKLIGSYAPGQDTFSVQATEVQTRPGQASFTCPGGGGVSEVGIFDVYQTPMFQHAFRDLRRQPDDSRASTGESAFSSGGGTCTTKYGLTLRQAQN